MDSGQEQNYWPGFVDALSNVVLTLIFVLVVFVFALSMASSKVEKRMQEVNMASEAQKLEAAKNPSTTAQENAELRQQLKAAEAQIEKLVAKESNAGNSNENAIGDKDHSSEVVTNESEAPKAKQGSVDMKQGNDQILLSYPSSVADMDEKSATELGHVLDGVQKTKGKRKILLRSVVGNEPYSAAQRLAYYRAITVRNFLISKGYGDSASITSKIVQSETPDVGHVEIVFERQ